MELNALNDCMDLSLLCQMKDLILRTTTVGSKSATGFSLFGDCIPDIKMEDKYGFKYPGEVLERYKERCIDSLCTVRALAFALAETRASLTPSMFVDTQLQNFMQLLRQHKKDIYISCALLLLTTNETECNELFEYIVKYNYNATQEAILAIYTLQQVASVWELARELAVKFFGRKGTISSYGNIQMYRWFLGRYSEEIRASKERHCYILKDLLDLACKTVKEDSAAWQRLLDEGYSLQELYYLQVALPYKKGIPECRDANSISAERIAFKVICEFLNAEYLESPVLLGVCEDLINRYSKYTVCLNGFAGIIEHLKYHVHVQNLDTFRYLYEKREKLKLPAEWFRADFGDAKWYQLHAWMDTQELRVVFENSLLSCPNPDMDLWIAKFDENMPTHYLDTFWNISTTSTNKVLTLLVDQEKYDIISLLEMYISDKNTLSEDELNQKWMYMIPNLKSVVSKLTNPTVFEFWMKLFEHFGVHTPNPFCALNDTVIRTCKESSYSYQLSFHPDILTEDQQRLLFSWLDTAIYMQKPRDYIQFLTSFLLSNDAKRLFPEESTQLFTLIREHVKAPVQRNRLYETYCSEEELAAIKEAEQKEAEQAKRKETAEKKRTYTKKLKQAISEVDSVDGQYKVLSEFMSKCYYDTIEMKICLKFLDDFLKKDVHIPQKTLMSIVDGLTRYMSKKVITWKQFKSYTERIEVLSNESAND